MRFRSLLGLVFILLLLSAIGMGVYFVQQETSYVGRAREIPQVYNLENSYVFASPLTTRADGREKIRVTVFLLSDEGVGVPQRQIKLVAPTDLQAAAIQAETDSRGQAVFEVTSAVAGRFPISAQVEGKNFPQTVFINFE